VQKVGSNPPTKTEAAPVEKVFGADGHEVKKGLWNGRGSDKKGDMSGLRKDPSGDRATGDRSDSEDMPAV